ncbi:MAG: methyltransferase domain-containing protein [Gammaproteobacteria bacterium]|nr:methyltransferase domain-containing protein [Gammaproteobacteria bacterium]
MQDKPLTQIAHETLAPLISPGDTVIDATVGNGHDTLFLAQKVGLQGKVYGFDIQQEALDICYQRLSDNNADKQVSLFHAGHETMPMLIPVDYHIEKIQAIMFNLGYLPGGDKHRRTQLSTTLSALHFALQSLSIDGAITLLAYTGHSGGKEECNAIKDWLSTFNDAYDISHIKPQGATNSPPELIIIKKT